MTEGEAQTWIADRFGAEKTAILKAYVSLLLEANQSQNLISKASESHIWTRHILDSAQIQCFAPDAENWLDIGSGPGLPGLVLAALSDRPTVLVEPRRKRVEFLNHVVESLRLPHVSICGTTIEKLQSEKFGAITARAYAPLPQILSSAIRFTESSTIWILPKGRSAEQELVAARQSWQGVFHVEHSLTDDEARIIIATGVRPR